MNAYTFNFNTIHLFPICKPFLAFSFQQKKNKTKKQQH